MKKIIIDPKSLSKLKRVTEQAELCDEAGQTVGYFQPARTSMDDVPKFSDAEIRRRMREKNYSTAEVLAQLKNSEKS